MRGKKCRWHCFQVFHCSCHMTCGRLYFDSIKRGWNYWSHFPPPSEEEQTITSPSSVLLLHLIRAGFLRVLAALQQSPQRPTYLPKWPTGGQGSAGAATSPVTGNKQQEGERRKSGEEEGEVGRKGGGDIQNTTMTRRCLELARSFCLLRTHTSTHTLGGAEVWGG